MSNKHLPRLFAQALNEKRVELFDEFIHPEYNNHNAYVEPGPAGVKAFFRHYLDAFPDTNVVMDDVIEEGDRISARFTYNGTFSEARSADHPHIPWPIAGPNWCTFSDLTPRECFRSYSSAPSARRIKDVLPWVSVHGARRATDRRPTERSGRR